MGIVRGIIAAKLLHFEEAHTTDLLTCGVLFSPVNRDPRTIHGHSRSVNLRTLGENR